MEFTHLDLVQLLVLGLVQGLVEFLPISSSGHLVLLPVVMVLVVLLALLALMALLLLPLPAGA